MRLHWALLALLLAACAPARVQVAEGPLRSPRDGALLVPIPAGVFRMGSADGAADEAPVHTVHLAGYRLDRCEVTNAQFQRFVEATGHRPAGPWRRGFAPGQEAHPVRYVTWADASAYAAWAGRRLPTEAEWERAARGPSSLRYPWGAAWDPSRAQADLPLAAGPAAVGSFPAGATPEGCLDMAGNVWEWTADWYDRHLYTHRPRGVCLDPTGPPDSAPPHADVTPAGNDRATRKVVRGGAWGPRGQEECRGARRAWQDPEGWTGDTGFRCATSL